MKNTLKALLASLLLATSAAASAAPRKAILVLLSSETELPLRGQRLDLRLLSRMNWGPCRRPCWRPAYP